MPASGSPTDRGARRRSPAAVLAAGLLSAVALGGLLALAARAAPAPGARAGTPAGEAPERPHRVVSLNLCADELVLRLADRHDIASVTTLAADPGSSTVAALAAGLPANEGLAEEIVPLAPDLVIAGAYTTRGAVDFLRRRGVPVIDLDTPTSLAEAYAQIRMVAARLGTPERGEAMVEEIEAAVSALPPPGARPPTAVVVRPNGFTAGRDTLPDALLRQAGLDNLASRLSPDPLGQLSVEEIVVARPDVLVVDDAPDIPPSLARDLMRHPALSDSAAHARRVSVPSRLWSCVGPQLAETLRRLSAAAGLAADRATP